MINWSDTLVREIVKERCIFFLGAGVSASATGAGGVRPPGWGAFLKSACGLVSDRAKKHSIESLIDQRKFLVALQAIKDTADPARYHSLLNRTFNASYEPSRLHEIIYELDAKVVITTNFDKIYEGYCLSYRPGGKPLHKVIDYTMDTLADELRDDTRLLIRAHGSINNVRDMIFTRAEYHAAKRKNVGFYELMKALFLTNTIVFVGCSLDDPDILLLLEDVHILGRHEKPHYALIRSDEANPYTVKDWMDTYNIKVLEYGPEYGDLFPEMEALLEAVNGERASYISMK
jgi:NAD-dependent SIR2 family protein deacetylase